MQHLITKFAIFVKNATGGGRVTLVALLPCLTALLLFAAVQGRPQPFPDSRDYLNLADGLAHSGSYCFYGGNVSPDPDNALIRTPGYPVLIAIGGFAVGNLSYFMVNLACLYGIAVITLRLVRKWELRRFEWLTVLLLMFSPARLMRLDSRSTKYRKPSASR